MQFALLLCSFACMKSPNTFFASHFLLTGMFPNRVIKYNKYIESFQVYRRFKAMLKKKVTCQENEQKNL